MTVARRNIYRHQQLERLFNPRSVAIIGASTNAKAFSSRTIANMARYPGKLFRVNPRYTRIGTEVCYPSIADLPETPDCAVIAVPREAVEAALLDCAKNGISGAIVFASGYGETGSAERSADQARLTEIAHDTGIKMIGPNCLGFINFSASAMVSFAAAEMIIDKPTRPGVGIVSQSGAVGFALGQAEHRGMALSHVLTFGNGADVHIADEIAFLAGEASCSAIACVLEGMPDPLQLLEAGELAWAADKPVIICKLGVGNKAASAAMSHTGSLAGSTAAYMALFERAGFIVVPTVERLLETAAFFAKAKRPTAHSVAAVGTSGGALIAAVDAAETYHVPMPALPNDIKTALQSYVPAFGSLRNPCDLTAMVTNDNSLLGNAVEVILSGEAYGAVVVPQTSLSKGNVERRKPLSAVGERIGKPICLTFSGGWLGGPGAVESEQDPNFQCFYSIDCCYATLSAWLHRDVRRRHEEQYGPRKLTRRSPLSAIAQARSLILATSNQVLTEREAKAVLALYGLPVVQEILVQSAEEAAIAAQSFGTAAVLKVESPDIPHKTEADVVRLNLKTSDEVKAAFHNVMTNARKIAGKPRIQGVLVQPMAPAGVEIMVGAKVDPLFGPLVVAGLGGILVELLHDTALELAPVTAHEATSMLQRLKGQTVLTGFRGSPPVDMDKLTDVIVRLSEFVDDQKDLIAEVDVNPLICVGSNLLAVDALIAIKQPTSHAEVETYRHALD